MVHGPAMRRLYLCGHYELMIFQALVLVSVSLVTCVASAQDNAGTLIAADKDEARIHFERGVDLYREGSFDAALAEFQRAGQLAPNYKILYNLAQVQAERHEYVIAVQFLTEYLQKGGSEIQAERRQSVMQDLEKLRQRISPLTVEVSVEGAEVFVNDVLAGRSPLTGTVPVNVGTCRVRAEKIGYLTRSQTVTIVGGEASRIALTLIPGAPVAQRSTEQRTITSRDTTPFWVSIGATVVLGGATGVFGGLALGANHDLDNALNRFPTQQTSVDSARHKLRTMAALTDGFGAGTLVAAGSAVYFLISPPEHKEVIATTAVHARISPTPTGLLVSGTF
jgi:hypothetical protein